ncbi:pimeloyl-ACP methyl ester carboxylesterase [Pseudonocardia sediminis]|uniref:Pimeloyl-ACP methyl ester carboxylesterase n=1 Tax=Pseudonocardia sediminis TaxID=1397368 RepID=A0A4V2FR07_PSEST|nr:alpha/beta hydrolase [Pseudonocardia sediminis]RZT86750.1 pimeloyl-ACP methyl ester carboxylesterase [Pseudonocardia sediminis]
MTEFVLVHGAAHGGWCWPRVAGPLRAAGHRVLTPTLTGLGSRAHHLTPEVGLGTMIDDVVAEIETEECRDAVLVGHSFGATVACGVAERVTDRLSALVLLDGVLADPGASVLDGLGPEIAAARLAAAGAVDGTPTMPPLHLDGFGFTDPADRAWVERRVTPHPVRSYTEPLPTTGPWGAGLPCTYIACTAPAYPPVAASAARAARQPGWTIRELATGHDAMVTAPDAVVDLLLEAAGQ